MSLQEDVACAIAKAHFDVVSDHGDEWNEREHFKVPMLMYLAGAKAAIATIHEAATLPDEVESVARAMWHDEAMRYVDIPVADWEKVEEFEREDWSRLARAALKAVHESRAELEDENDRMIGEVNDLMMWLTKRGFTVKPHLSLVRNVRSAFNEQEAHDDEERD